MYAVFADRSIVYLGDSEQDAIETLGQKDPSSMAVVNTLPALVREFHKYLKTQDDPEVSAQSTEDEELEELVNDVLDRLDEAGLNAENVDATVKKIRESGEEALKTVKAASRKGIRSLGACLTNLGSLLSEAGTEPKASETCHRDHPHDGVCCSPDCDEDHS